MANFTKKAIKETFIALLEEHPLSDITVKDIAEKWNIKPRTVQIMCAEGNTPARDKHIVRNLNPLDNPWFFFDGSERNLRVSVFHFKKDELRHY